MAEKRSRKFLQAQNQVEDRVYTVVEGIALAKKIAFAKFDETVDLAFRLGVDPRHADQMLRGAISLPKGRGKSMRICVITQGENLDKALGAGADFVGSDDLVAKIAGGWLEFDRVIASPDMMAKLGRIGKILGPRGMMPNPKLGTVTINVDQAVKEHKAGKVEYRTEKNGIVHVPVGKKSFSQEDLRDNIDAMVSAIIKAKPPSAKGIYLKSLTLSTTMGPGIKLDTMAVASSSAPKAEE